MAIMKRMNDFQLRSAFNAAGLRLTRQRLLICRELAGRYDHPDVEHLFQAVKPRLRQISLFTVYRTMNALEAVGMAWRVTTFKGHARYDGNVQAHAHFLCEKCGHIDDVDTQGAACHELAAHAQQCVKGRVRRVEMMIIGECEACRAALPVPPPASPPSA